MKTLLIVAACNLLAPLVIAANKFVDDAPPKFIHIREEEDGSKYKFDTYISTSKIGIVTLCEEGGKFEVRVITLAPAPGSVGGGMRYSVDFPDKDTATKCVARILQIMNQAEQAAPSDGDKPSN
jgi:hypothetical protein